MHTICIPPIVRTVNDTDMHTNDTDMHTNDADMHTNDADMHTNDADMHPNGICQTAAPSQNKHF